MLLVKYNTTTSCLNFCAWQRRFPQCKTAFLKKSAEAADGHSNSFFLVLPRILAYLKVPINDPVDESNFFFLIPILACAPFLGFSCYLIKRGA